MHYEELYIVDYRYFDRNLVNFAKQYKVTDMMFLHNTFVAHARYTRQRESSLMKTGLKAPATPKPVVKADTNLVARHEAGALHLKKGGKVK